MILNLSVGTKDQAAREKSCKQRKVTDSPLSSATPGTGSACLLNVCMRVRVSAYVCSGDEKRGREGPDEGIISQPTVQTIVHITLPWTIVFGLEVGYFVCVFVCECVLDGQSAAHSPLHCTGKGSRKERQNVEGDWVNHLSITFKRTNQIFPYTNKKMSSISDKTTATAAPTRVSLGRLGSWEKWISKISELKSERSSLLTRFPSCFLFFYQESVQPLMLYFKSYIWNFETSTF